MRLSTKGRYAVRAMLDLALADGERPIPREDIALRQDISAPYLAQIFAKLCKAGLVNSVKGPGGGYHLARSPSDIRAGDILRAVEIPLAPVACVDDAPAARCDRSAACAAHRLWKRLDEEIEEVLDEVTLMDLCAEACMLVGNETGEAQS